MNANAKHFFACKGFRNREKQHDFFGSRRWETDCGGDLQSEEAPDRWVFLVSLIVLPLMLML